MRVGFIGLGNQGTPIAQRLAASDFPTTVWARRPEATVDLAATGAKVAATPADVGCASDVVGVCVFDGHGVDEVLFGERGVIAGLAPGGVVVVHSTVSPLEIAAIARRAAHRDVTVLDAPVSGGGAAAAVGELLVLLAGPDAACAAVRPMLETYAGRIVRLGAAVGNAQAAKLINNALFAANIALVVEASRLGNELGLGAALLDVVRAASARSFGADVLAGAGSAPVLARGPFGAAISKDLALLADTLGPSAAGSPVLDIANDLLMSSTPDQQPAWHARRGHR